MCVRAHLNGINFLGTDSSKGSKNCFFIIYNIDVNDEFIDFLRDILTVFSFTQVISGYISFSIIITIL